MQRTWHVIGSASSLVVLLVAGAMALAMPEIVVAGGCLAILAAALVLSQVGARRASTSRLERRVVARARQRAEGARRTVLYDGDYGLYQLWYFHLRVREEAERCRRYGLSMAVLVVRLDPSITDQEERPWQMEIAHAAHLTAKSVRAVDITAVVERRTFSLCLVHCDRVGAETASIRILRALKHFNPVIGSVVFPEENVDAGSLLEVAQERCASSLAA